MSSRPPVFHAVTATAQEWRRVLEHLPIALLPLGSTCFHGYHLPYGTDPLITAAAGEHLLTRFGGMLFPALPFPESESAAAVVNHAVSGMLECGFRLVIVLGPPCRDLGSFALSGIPDGILPGNSVICTTLWEILKGGACAELGSTLETSLMMRLHPSLVRLPALDDPAYGIQGIQGPPPQLTASPQQGRIWFDAALDILTDMVHDALDGESVKPAWYYAHKRGEMIP